MKKIAVLLLILTGLAQAGERVLRFFTTKAFRMDFKLSILLPERFAEQSKVRKTVPNPSGRLPNGVHASIWQIPSSVNSLKMERLWLKM